mgnify:CR=1 FL=1
MKKWYFSSRSDKWLCLLGGGLICLTSMAAKGQESPASGVPTESKQVVVPPEPASAPAAETQQDPEETPPANEEELTNELLELEQLLSAPAVTPGETPGTLTEL